MQYAGSRMLAEVDDGIGLVTFNQPAKHNAMSLDMWTGLGEILNNWREDRSVRVVVLTGAGARAFVSGADISQFEKHRSNDDARRAYDEQTKSGRDALAAFDKPMIARIRGFCLGGGLAIAMKADLRIAGVDSEFGIPAAKLGIAYGFESVRDLVALVGPAHARMILYTGQRIGAREAERMGLVNRVVNDEDLSDTVVDLARAIADNAPLSVHASLLTIREVLRDPADRDMDALVRASEACFNSQDYREGRTAFMEKRPPRFRGA